MRIKSLVSSALVATGLTFCLSPYPALAFVTVNVTPTEQAVAGGSTAVFNAQVSTTAGETITGYSWQMSTNGLSPFNPVPGATTATCTLTNVQPANAGYYFVRVTYNAGQVSVSEAVRLIVQDQARIVDQPQSLFRNILVPTNASFSVGALGTPPLSYRWRFNGANLTDSPPRITGAATATLTLTNLTTADSGSYTVVVTNAVAAVTSQVATLDVVAPPGIAAQPLDRGVVVGSNATFSVTPSGGPPYSFGWQKNGTNLADGGRIIGAFSNLLTIAAVTTNDEGSYSVIVTNPVGSVASSNALLTVLFPAAFTSPTNAVGRQGGVFDFTNTATGTIPIYFGATNLPLGLSIEPTNGVISGTPTVTGLFNVTLFATNAAMTTTGKLAITLTTGAPGFFSPLTAVGRQGSPFNYTIPASNRPAVFSASGVPSGLNVNATSGVISGVPLVDGDFYIPLGVTNQYGGDSNLLTLTLASALPVITSSSTAFGTENQSGFRYTIRASNAPTEFGASDLPLGLTVDTTNGVISGTPVCGGTFIVPIWAINAWGTGRANLTLTVNYAPLGGLAIINVITNYHSPYLLDFSFALVDDSDPTSVEPVVRDPSQLQVICREDGEPISSATAFVVEKGNKKQLRSFVVLDYSYSMYAAPGAIDAMETAAKTFINYEPEHALFGIYEFHADYANPNLVTGFIADKALLNQYIDGIETNYVKGNYAGSRCWDAIYAALGQFGTNNNADEQRYLVVVSNGNDDSSQLNTNPAPLDVIVALAQTSQVRIYAVAYGNDINTVALQQLTSETMGQYYQAPTSAELAVQFSRIAKNLDGQYLLRWSTLKRAAIPFVPSFEIAVGGRTNIFVGPDYNPPDYAGDVTVGELRLVADAQVGPQTIRLRATYVPRYVRALRFSCRPNYPCTISLASTNTGEILYGWSLTETNDAAGVRILTLMSPDPTNLFTSITYGALGDLVDFRFTYPDSVTATQAFSSFTIDNSIYTGMLPPPNGQSFVLPNASSFIFNYGAPPPHGTPIPWLRAHGFTSNYAAAELTDPNGNGMPVWLEYLAGLDPRNTNSTFKVWADFTTGQTPQIRFSAVSTRTYRVEASTTLTNWVLLRDDIPGYDGDIRFIDNRNLSSVKAVFYRVGVY